MASGPPLIRSRGLLREASRTPVFRGAPRSGLGQTIAAETACLPSLAHFLPGPVGQLAPAPSGALLLTPERARRPPGFF